MQKLVPFSKCAGVNLFFVFSELQINIIERQIIHFLKLVSRTVDLQ
jgi:hypothetical protein